MGKPARPYGGMSTPAGAYNKLSTTGHFFRGYGSPSKGFGGSGRGGYGSQMRGQGVPARGKGKSARCGRYPPLLPQVKREVTLVEAAASPARGVTPHSIRSRTAMGNATRRPKAHGEAHDKGSRTGKVSPADDCGVSGGGAEKWRQFWDP